MNSILLKEIEKICSEEGIDFEKVLLNLTKAPPIGGATMWLCDKYDTKSDK